MNNSQATSPSKLPKKIQTVIENSKTELKSIVLVTGVFDALHFEHGNFLKKARDLGDVLIVGIESDFRVRQIKGKNRPVNSQEERVSSLLDLNITSNIFILPDEFDKAKSHLELIKTIMPNFLAVSSHTDHLDKKREIMNSVDGELVVIHEQNPKVSSTKIINGGS